jgi:hypothetical protein
MPLSSLRAVLIASLLVAAPGAFLRAQTVEIGFDGPSSLSGPAGSSVAASYFATLTHLPAAPSGAQGWSIILDASNAEFTGISLEGTTADTLVDKGACRNIPITPCSFVTNQMGSGMACSAVVLDFDDPVTLPLAGVSTIAKIDIAVEIAACGGSVDLEYVDAAGCFAGAADTNVITIGFESQTFANGQLVQVPKSVAVEDTTCDPAALVGELIADVAALDAPPGVKLTLTGLLRRALALLSDGLPGNDQQAVPILQTFITAVNGLPAAVIADEDAAALTAKANAVIQALGG